MNKHSRLIPVHRLDSKSYGPVWSMKISRIRYEVPWESKIGQSLNERLDEDGKPIVRPQGEDRRLERLLMARKVDKRNAVIVDEHDRVYSEVMPIEEACALVREMCQ